jgi:dTDP-4-amino-4,6-dideoxygalactose transaminase
MRVYRQPQPVFVARPTMPPLADYVGSLEAIWETHWLTNEGRFHEAFKDRLAGYLGVEHVNLFCNGTLALLVALQTLEIDSGEVITTPFTFPATPHVLHWNRVQPVFADIDPVTLNLDPRRVEEQITADTRAILAVHVFGIPCDVEALQDVGARHGLPVIYDAAHTFGVRYKGRALCDFGDAAVLSFHATKLFTTGEGGALVVRTAALQERAQFLKNFGIADEETVIGPGINGKMNEFQAAFGLLQLEQVRAEIEHRRALAERYRFGLAGVPGMTLPPEPAEVEPNYAYFPVLIEAGAYGLSRDALHQALKEFNFHTRKYFYPLCSQYPCYAGLRSARADNLPIAGRIAGQVLCLPIYGTLPHDTADALCALLRELPRAQGGEEQ